ncbi:MAG: flagellar filament capping protein FliD [Ignavibacteria bacterium]|jgi:flagellar hook-associated protein 2|nr:flagellar filament capping protein FliD [Ignavibacteria bacterium]
MAVSSASSTSNTLVDQYVDAYIQTQLYRYTPYDNKADKLTAKQNFFTQLNSKLNTLLSAMDRFGTFKSVTKTTGEGDDAVTTTSRQFVKANAIDEKFITRKITASSNDFVTATAQGKALTGTNSVKVLQLATNDSYIGKQADISKHAKVDEFGAKVLDDDGKEVMVGSLDDRLAAARTAGEPLKFTINIGGKSKEISVDIGESDTNEDVMKRIVTAVNKTGDDGDIGDKINAAFVKDTTGTARLTFTSKTTGEENQISFSGVDGLVSDLFGIVNTPLAKDEDGNDIEGKYDRSQYDDGDANSFGFQKSDASALNSKINLNGVTVIRGSNSFNDAIDGVTLNLKKVNSDSDAPTSLTTDIDPAAVTTLLSPMMQAYNSIAAFVVAGKTDSGADPSITGLGTALRNIVSEDLSGWSRANDTNGVYAAADAEDGTQPIKYLAELGFKIGSDGTLSISDTTKFEEILRKEDGPKLIADAMNSFASRVSEYLDSFASRDGQEGLIKSRLSSISQQIDANNKKITAIDASIDKMAESTRKQYTSYLSAYYNATNQAALISAFASSSSAGAYDSLVSSQAKQSAS